MDEAQYRMRFPRSTGDGARGRSLKPSIHVACRDFYAYTLLLTRLKPDSNPHFKHLWVPLYKQARGPLTTLLIVIVPCSIHKSEFEKKSEKKMKSGIF